jgi:hypothetical protein
MLRNPIFLVMASLLIVACSDSSPMYGAGGGGGGGTGHGAGGGAGGGGGMSDGAGGGGGMVVDPPDDMDASVVDPPDSGVTDPDPDPDPDPEDPPDDTLEWHQANLTHYTSYPECCDSNGDISQHCQDNPGDNSCDECTMYNGCMWAGQFAGVDGQQSLEWVMEHNIAAIHEDNFGQYGGKTLRVRQGAHEIDVTVYDMCGDSDCDGCCTQNASQNGYDFLIDFESFTMERFGGSDGSVEWACIDC